jgi:STE24 endopeptidase
MYLSNPWFVLALFASVGLYHLELIATMLNMSALKPEIPDRLKDTVTQDEHERSLEYARISAKFDVMQSTVMLAVFLAFWFGGGFEKVDAFVWELCKGPMVSGLWVIGLLFVAQGLISLPFEVYDTFVIEKGFGFNKTTVGTFIMDRVKGLMLTALLGLPLLALLLWLFERFSLAALFGWIIVSAFSLLMTWLAPRLIMPMFFKFRPLEDEGLKKAIFGLSEKLAFPVSDVSIVDGSRRSTKANAFFTGFGRTKRIALFDTLIANHSQDEILAVLAHEIGHCKRGHVPKHIALSLALSGLMFGLLHFALHDPRLTAAFGVTVPSVAWGLVFFSIIYTPLSTLLGLIGGALSRKNEFEADAFAKEAMGSAEPMISALTRLSRDHLSNPTPHPFYVALHYSHPPILQRVAALEI